MKKKSTKTLIMIPVYNGEGFIERTLESCINQSIITDIWVVDNRSTDKTQSIVRKYGKKYSQLKLIINRSNLGRIGNWNRCLDIFEKSKFKYIKYVFAGDEIFPECVEEVEKAFEKDKEIGAVVFPYYFAGLNGQLTRDTDRAGDKLFSVKEINIVNLKEAGILGAIICDAYNKDFIQGYRFSNFFLGKSDFDFEVLSRSKAYFLDKVLARFNEDAHRTLHTTIDFIFEAEVSFNRIYRLEKMKKMFSKKEYLEIKERIMIDTVINNVNYFGLMTYVKLGLELSARLVSKYYIGLKSQSRKYLGITR